MQGALRTHCCIAITDKDPLLNEIKKKLAEGFESIEKEFVEKSRQDSYYYGVYRDKERIRHIQELIEYFGKIGKMES